MKYTVLSYEIYCLLAKIFFDLFIIISTFSISVALVLEPRKENET